ncbi:MAG: class I SAM-dependent methyltransferase [Planctomycetota bacterium]
MLESSQPSFFDAKAATMGALTAEFAAPPFSVLNAREGWWQQRKAAWIGLGIKSEVGRSENLLSFSKAAAKMGYQKEAKEQATSIFDPVLCELLYRWFCPPGGQVLDPFAGGSVRGIVASVLGRHYWGCDLSLEQMKENEKQAADICTDLSCQPHWFPGDAKDLAAGAPLSDFVFSCPPYGSLERYSDDPRDLSTMMPGTFMESLGQIIAACYEKLRANRFACFVVGEYRDQAGVYPNFVGHTVDAFRSVASSITTKSSW